MISTARELRKEFFEPFEAGDIASAANAGSGRFATVRAKLQNIYDVDDRALETRLAKVGLDGNFRELKKDWEARSRKSYLFRPPDHRSGKKEVIQCVLGRAFLCQIMSLHLLEDAESKDRELARTRIQEGFVVESDADADRVAATIDLIRRIHVVLGRAADTVDDYCHFLDLIYHLAGDEKLDLYGKRRKADIYAFQIENAIDSLVENRTAARLASALLIRSLLEVSVRRVVFDANRMAEAFVVPTPRLDFPRLIKTCYEQGLEFGIEEEVILKVWENLNLVVHLGFRLNEATLMHFDAIARSVALVLPADTKPEDQEAAATELVRKVITRLLELKLAEEVAEPQHPDPSLNIYYRY